MKKIQSIDPILAIANAKFTSCIILTHDNRIMLQKRPKNWRTYPGYICAFGGHVENNETPLEAIIRELSEEVGAHVLLAELIFLDAYTEEITGHREIVFGYFWHDKQAKMTGCYEAEPFYLNHPNELSQQPLVMDDVPWLIGRAINLYLLNLS